MLVDGTTQIVPMAAGYKCFPFTEYQARLKQIEIVLDAYDRLRDRCNTKEVDRALKKIR